MGKVSCLGSSFGEGDGSLGTGDVAQDVVPQVHVFIERDRFPVALGGRQGSSDLPGFLGPTGCRPRPLASRLRLQCVRDSAQVTADCASVRHVCWKQQKPRVRPARSALLGAHQTLPGAGLTLKREHSASFSPAVHPEASGSLTISRVRLTRLWGVSARSLIFCGRRFSKQASELFPFQTRSPVSSVRLASE